jgi:hypothetical protein
MRERDPAMVRMVGAGFALFAVVLLIAGLVVSGRA